MKLFTPKAIGITATLFASVSLAATAQARPMTPEDVAKIETLGAMAVSPDGSRVAFTTASLPDVTEGEKDGTVKHELKVAWGPDAARAYLPKEVSPGGVSFTPDGRMVTFAWSKDDEDRAVWGVPIDGGTYKKLGAVDGANVAHYRFSPDGQTLYMLAGAEEDEQREEQAQAGFNAHVYEEEFKPTRMFAAKVGAELDENPREIVIPGFVNYFDLSPDGSLAMVETAPTPLVDDSLTKKRINIIDVKSGDITIVKTPGKIGDAEFSPDGSQISLIAGVDMNDPAETTMHLVDTKTGDYRALNAGAAEAAVDAEWLADGRLATIIHVGAQSVLRMYNADGSVESEIDPGDLILARIDANAGTIAVAANSPKHPNELFVLDGSNFARWTRHNPWLNDITFGNQRAV